jgi:DNA-binding FadR family transcriptional regulator
VQTSEETTPSRQRRYLVVAQALLTAIGNGKYAVGERLPAHSEVAAQAKVSRATAREALLALELIGAVDVRQGDGTFVRGMGTQALGTSGSPLDTPPRELIETRLQIEPVVASLAAGRITDSQLVQLEGYVEQQRQLIDKPGQVAQFVSLGLQFHADLAPGCGNSVLADVVVELVDLERHPLWALVNQRSLLNTACRQRQVDEHGTVLDAIRQRRPDLAAQSMRAHLAELNLMMFNSAEPVSAGVSDR